MSVKFKKLAVASAVAGAMGFAGSASAITLGDSGSVLLVPHVICDTATQTNTLIGAITSGVNGPLPTAPVADVGGVMPTTGFGVGTATARPARISAKQTGANVQRVHWYFYDVNSNHVIDGTIAVTANDFVRFDWCGQLEEAGFVAELDGTPGYILMMDDRFDNVRLDTGVQLQGHSYLITGNWASQAFIPVLTVNGANIGAGVDGYPRVNALPNGISYETATSNDTIGNFRQVTMRYFLDPALSTGTDFVFWFNRNARGTAADRNYDRTRAAVEVFDSEQVFKNSSNANLGAELNIIRNTPTQSTFPGMRSGFDGDAVNTGLVHFYVPTATLSAQLEPYGGAAAGNPPVQGAAGGVGTAYGNGANFRHSGVAFGFVRLGAGGNAQQVQTELASEGNWLTGPF